MNDARRNLEGGAGNALSLSELQEWIATVIRDPEPLPGRAEMDEASARHVRGNERLLPVEQLEIYREQFWLRHSGCLLEDFPALAGHLGNERWARLVRDYLETDCLRSGSLRDLGAGLPAFVATGPFDEIARELAALEWAFVDCFDAPESEGLDGEFLAKLAPEDWERATFLFAPALRLLSFRFPVHDYRRRHLQSVETSQALPLPEEKASNVVVYRHPDRELYDKEVSPTAFALLTALKAGVPLLTACEIVVAESGGEEELAKNIASWFASFGTLGWITGVSLLGKNPGDEGAESLLDSRA